MFKAFEQDELRLISGALAQNITNLKDAVKMHTHYGNDTCEWERDLRKLKLLHNESLVEIERRSLHESS